MTVLYYSSNREEPGFEARIMARLLESCGDLPVVSVTQRPTDLGRNICVGDVGHSYLNEWRQIQIGAEAAGTEWVAFAEADFLYPEEYFRFQPKGGDIHRCGNVWIVFRDGDGYSRKRWSEGAQVCRREYIVRYFKEFLAGYPEWLDGEVRPIIGRDKIVEYYKISFNLFDCAVPCVSFKTGNGMRPGTRTLSGAGNRAAALPHWGNIADLKRKYLDG
jgi:hypothetical protein